MNQRQLPAQWHLQTRPLFTVVEHTVWQWPEQVFFDHHVGVKIPVIRFLLPRSTTQSQCSHGLLKGVYCTFTVCASDGSVVGCIDVPGHNGLRASHRDLKKKLFEECGVTYAVLSVNQLPTLKALRAVFLGDMALTRPPSHGHASTSQMPFSQIVDVAPVPALVLSSLQSKLDHNCKVRLAKIDELGVSLGSVDDKADQTFAVLWKNSFIMGDECQKFGKTQTLNRWHHDCRLGLSVFPSTPLIPNSRSCSQSCTHFLNTFAINAQVAFPQA